MIRYSVTAAKLRQLIEAESAGWMERAHEKTEGFRALGRYEENSSIWSEVKPVYMELQGESKCAYCERKLESSDIGRIEQDVEHFRPKGNVKAWKPSQKLKDLNIPFTAVAGDGKGYHLLPYHIFNYAAACKPCNSTLKKDYFPIAGDYDLANENPQSLSDEKAYLIYPIGSVDEDPGKLIEFHGTSPLPVAATGHKRNRALVTIEFFRLDDPNKRKNLYRDRSMVIVGLYPLLKDTTVGTTAEKAAARTKVKNLLHSGLPHFNCAKSFKRLFESDPVEAKEIYENALRLISTGS